MASPALTKAVRSVTAEARARLADAATAQAEQERIRSDPADYCSRQLGLEPWSKQREILESVRNHKRTAVRSSHGVGKTAIAARVARWWLRAFTPSKVVTTATVWTQVRYQLWPEIASAHLASNDMPQARLSQTELWLSDDHFAVGLSTDTPERLQGFHSPHLLVVVDEASGVEEPLFQAVESLLTTEGSRLLLIGNPTRPAGTFYHAFHRNRSQYKTIHISTFDAPAFTGEQVSEQVRQNLPGPGYVKDALQLYASEQSPAYEVRVLGEFPSSSEDAVIGLAAVEESQDPERRPHVPGIPVVVACDVARFGSDETVIVKRLGGSARIARTRLGQDTMATAGLIGEVASEAKAEGNDWPTIVVDDVGVGGGVTDRLRELGREDELFRRIVAFNGAESPNDPSEYPNRRSEVWFEFADQIGEVALDADDQLLADLVAPTYKLDSRGRRVVEPKAETKKRLGRSPDRADAVLMAFAQTHRVSTRPPDTGGGRRARTRPGFRRGMSL